MNKTTLILGAGLVSVGMLAGTATARAEATQEPGVVGFYYRSTPYLMGGYGHRFSPFPSYYYEPRGYKRAGAYGRYGHLSTPGVVAVGPQWSYGYYGLY
jgi:hypothetical protein